MMYVHVKKAQAPSTTFWATQQTALVSFQWKYFSGSSNGTVWFPHLLSLFTFSGLSGGAWRQCRFDQGFSPDALFLPTPNCLAWATKHHLASQEGQVRRTPQLHHSGQTLDSFWITSSTKTCRSFCGPLRNNGWTLKSHHTCVIMWV